MTATAIPATATGIVCGKCSTFTNKIRHASVTAVKLCTLGQRVEDAIYDGMTVVKINSLPPVPGVPSPSAMLAEAEASAARQLENVTGVPARKPAEDIVPAGRYALEISGTVRFFEVSHGRKGSRWEGRVFVNRQAGDELHPVRGGERTGILAAILVDPRAASARYGRELGRCGVCSRTLTDPESIAAGMGRVCAGRF